MHERERKCVRNNEQKIDRERERREGGEREREYWTVLHRDMESTRELYCGETLWHLVMMVILTENRYTSTVSERKSERERQSEREREIDRAKEKETMSTKERKK